MLIRSFYEQKCSVPQSLIHQQYLYKLEVMPNF